MTAQIREKTHIFGAKKNYKNRLKNRDLRRRKPLVRQIKNGKVTKTYEEE